MPRYIRFHLAGARYFLTLVTHARRPFLTEEPARRCLRTAWIETRRGRPFHLAAVCLLPDHLHTIWILPQDDGDFSARVGQIKVRFTKAYRALALAEGPRSASRVRRREAGLWQRRFWEHLISDDEDLRRHMDYLHYNPVKHCLVTRPADWAWSTFHRYVRLGYYGADWGEVEPAGIAAIPCAGEAV